MVTANRIFWQEPIFLVGHESAIMVACSSILLADK